jgi:hypothetical protein
LEAFVRRIEALVNAGRLSDAEVAPLLDVAHNAIRQLCWTPFRMVICAPGRG